MDRSVIVERGEGTKREGGKDFSDAEEPYTKCFEVLISHAEGGWGGTQTVNLDPRFSHCVAPSLYSMTCPLVKYLNDIPEHLKFKGASSNRQGT